jgi:hypothetical protein
MESKVAKPCQVHHVPLQKGIVPIQYGMPFFGPQEFYLASQQHFPNARSKFIGGCVVQDFTDAVVLFCPQCRHAETAWLQKTVSPTKKAANTTR